VADKEQIPRFHSISEIKRRYLSSQTQDESRSATSKAPITSGELMKKISSVNGTSSTASGE
jgi:hypothetical protein